MFRRSAAMKSWIWLAAAFGLAAGTMGAIASHAQTPEAASPPSSRNEAPGSALIMPPVSIPAPLSRPAPGSEAPPLIAPSPTDNDMPLKPPAAGATAPPLHLAPASRGIN